MKITVNVSKSDAIYVDKSVKPPSFKTKLNEVVKALQELSNDYPDFIKPDNIEMVIECQDDVVVERHYID